MRALSVARQGKSTFGTLKRVSTIFRRYGSTPTKVAQSLEKCVQTLEKFHCGATFPITASTLAGNERIVERYLNRGIEFAVHGYQHLDHTRLPLELQLENMYRARRLFAAGGMIPRGFRAPYLRCNGDTLTAIADAGFVYDASWALAWEVSQVAETPEYQRALSFYHSDSAVDYPSLPRWYGDVVRIPYNLPDDEALVERLSVKTEECMGRIWVDILDRTWKLGELFCLGLHPERTTLCQSALLATLKQAVSKRPQVWLTTLEEIATWWLNRTRAKVTCTEKGDRLVHVSVRGPKGVVILSRGVQVEGEIAGPWLGEIRISQASELDVRASCRPFIGVTPSSAPRLKNFLRQQGYIVEETDCSLTHTFVLDRPRFDETDERALLEQIDQGDFPLVWLGRWPNGARSALCVTGDLDAFTLWDYASRLLPARLSTYFLNEHRLVTTPRSIRSRGVTS